MLRSLPRPAELALRAVLATALVLPAARLLQRMVIEPLLPVFDALVRFLAIKFSVQEVAVVQGPALGLRFRANLAVPVDYAGQTVFPVGWNGGPAGGYEVLLPLGGLLQYTALLLIIVLAWPAGRWREYGLRLLLALPLAAVLLLCEAPMTVVAELWNSVRNQVNPEAFCGWMVWSRFLMGGGGLLIAGLFGVGAIAVARRFAGRPGAHAI